LNEAAFDPLVNEIGFAKEITIQLQITVKDLGRSVPSEEVDTRSVDKSFQA